MQLQKIYTKSFIYFTLTIRNPLTNFGLQEVAFTIHADPGECICRNCFRRADSLQRNRKRSPGWIDMRWKTRKTSHWRISTNTQKNGKKPKKAETEKDHEKEKNAK